MTGPCSTTLVPRRVAAFGVLLVSLGACATPAPPTPEPAEGAEEPVAARPIDPMREALIDQLDGFATGLADVRTLLEEADAAADLGDAPGMRRAATRARDLLVSPAGQDSAQPSAPFLPSTDRDRGTMDGQNDALTALLVTARQAGGPLGRVTLDVLRDPIAGDVGGWERDAAGMIDQIEQAATAPGTGDAREAVILELDGALARTLAWTLVAADATSVEVGVDATAHALQHLGVIEVALAVVDDVAETTDDEGAP